MPPKEPPPSGGRRVPRDLREESSWSKLSMTPPNRKPRNRRIFREGCPGKRAVYHTRSPRTGGGDTGGVMGLRGALKQGKIREFRQSQLQANTGIMFPKVEATHV